MSADDTPLSDLLFDIEITLCNRFPALTPMSLRRTRARDIFKIIVKLGKHAKKEKKEEAKKAMKRIIKRPASDTWF